MLVKQLQKNIDFSCVAIRQQILQAILDVRNTKFCLEESLEENEKETVQASSFTKKKNERKLPPPLPKNANSSKEHSSQKKEESKVKGNIEDKVKGKQKSKPESDADVVLPVFKDKFVDGNYTASYVFDPKYQELNVYSESSFGNSYYSAGSSGAEQEEDSYKTGSDLVSLEIKDKMIKQKRFQNLTNIGKNYAMLASPWMGNADEQLWHNYTMTAWGFAESLIKYALANAGAN